VGGGRGGGQKSVTNYLNSPIGDEQSFSNSHFKVNESVAMLNIDEQEEEGLKSGKLFRSHFKYNVKQSFSNFFEGVHGVVKKYKKLDNTNAIKHENRGPPPRF
jgi:hypothetical protein